MLTLSSLRRAVAPRTQLITASEIAALLGFSPWQTPLQVFRRKQGRDDKSSSVAMRAGNASEGVLFAHYAKTYADGPAEQGLAYEDAPVQGPLEWMAASPDALAHVYPYDGPIVVEFKTTGQSMDELPAHYRSQCDWLLACIPVPAVELVAAVEMPDRLRALLGSTDPHDVAKGQAAFAAMLDSGVIEVRRFMVERDDQRIAALVAQVEAWHDVHMVAGFPPDPRQGDAEHIAATFDPADNPEPHLDGLAPLVGAYKDAKAQLDDAEAKASVAKAALLLGLEASGVEAAKTSAGSVSFKSQAGRAGIDADMLRSQWPDIAAKVAKMGSPFRVLRVGK